MEKYTKYLFDGLNSNETEIVSAMLNEFDFLGFEENDKTLIAYKIDVGQNELLNNVLSDIEQQFKVKITTQELVEKNWNEKWESDYQPVQVGRYCLIRADFHLKKDAVKHDIVVTPKMSFGTGHHETTFMMIEHMEKIDFKAKKVFDYGCGTGVLAILASFEGASYVEGIDYDKWAYENSLENFELNGINENFKLVCGTINDCTRMKFDVVLANINRNVILTTMEEMVDVMHSESILLISGILCEDIIIVEKTAKKYNLIVKKTKEKGKWASLLLMKG